MKKKVPRLRTDEQAEAFLAQDLSKLDFSQFKPVHFEFEKKDEQINEAIARGREGSRKRARYTLYAVHSGNAGTGDCGGEVARCRWVGSQNPRPVAENATRTGHPREL